MEEESWGLGNSEEMQSRAKMELYVDRESVIIFTVIIGGKGKRCLRIVNSFVQWHITEFNEISLMLSSFFDKLLLKIL